MVIFFMESSNGKLLHHKDGSVGPLGIKPETVAFVNKRLNVQFEIDAMHDRDNAFSFARIYIRMFKMDHPGATERDIISMWRCGWTGRHRMTIKQYKYVREAMKRLELLKAGKDYTK